MHFPASAKLTLDVIRESVWGNLWFTMRCARRKCKGICISETHVYTKEPSQIWTLVEQ
jgi:hypothetical protein